MAWTTRDGKWSAYQDGEQRGSGENLASWHAIKPQGVIILGQEQVSAATYRSLRVGAFPNGVWGGAAPNGTRCGGCGAQMWGLPACSSSTQVGFLFSNSFPLPSPVPLHLHPHTNPSSPQLIPLSLLCSHPQDTLGGRFDATQAFVGELAHFAVWDHMLAPAEILALANCTSRLQGNVIQWDDQAVEVFGGASKAAFTACDEGRKA